MAIQHVNLSRLSSKTKQQILKSFKFHLNTGSFILGDSVKKFEDDFARYTGCKYSIGVASGSDALLLALKAVGIHEGDEVILPTMTFMATAAAVIHLGGKPVFVDSLPDHPNIDPSLIEKKITRRTKAIIPVHMNGYPAQMDDLVQIAKKHALFLIEDACQAHGSLYKRKRLGSFGDINAFSFYPSKNLGALGDGGAITTSEKKYADRILSLRNHGQIKQYINSEVGFNSRLDSIQADVLRIKLRYLDEMNSKRKQHAKQYILGLSDLPLSFLPILKNTQPNFHNFVILVEKRDKLKSFLEKKGIQTGIHYPLPLHLQPALKPLGYNVGDFPHAEKYAATCLSLPMFPELKRKEVEIVIKSIHQAFRT